MLYCPVELQNRRPILVQQGVYILVLGLSTETNIAVGRLATVHFPAGTYLYIGSAMGPGGLAARLARHHRRRKKLHWHIDYLREFAAVEAIWWHTTGEPLECRWAAAALSLPGASIPAPGFGASDCTCQTHLVRVANPDPAAFAKLAGIPESELETATHGQNA